MVEYVHCLNFVPVIGSLAFKYNGIDASDITIQQQQQQKMAMVLFGIIEQVFSIIICPKEEGEKGEISIIGGNFSRNVGVACKTSSSVFLSLFSQIDSYWNIILARQKKNWNKINYLFLLSGTMCMNRIRTTCFPTWEMCVGLCI